MIYIYKKYIYIYIYYIYIWVLCKRLPWPIQANNQFSARQLSFDKEIHDRKLTCLRCLLT